MKMTLVIPISRSEKQFLDSGFNALLDKNDRLWCDRNKNDS